MNRNSFIFTVSLLLLLSNLQCDANGHLILTTASSENEDSDTLKILFRNNSNSPIHLPKDFALIFDVTTLSSDCLYSSYFEVNSAESLNVNQDQTIQILSTRLTKLKWSPWYSSDRNYMSTIEMLKEILKKHSASFIRVNLSALPKECLFFDYTSNYLGLRYSDSFFTGMKIAFEQPTDFIYNRVKIEVIEVADSGKVSFKVSNLKKSEAIQSEFEIQIINGSGRYVSRNKIKFSQISKMENESDLYQIWLEESLSNFEELVSKEDCLFGRIIFNPSDESPNWMNVESNSFKINK